MKQSELNRSKLTHYFLHLPQCSESYSLLFTFGCSKVAGSGIELIITMPQVSLINDIIPWKLEFGSLNTMFLLSLLMKPCCQIWFHSLPLLFLISGAAEVLLKSFGAFYSLGLKTWCQAWLPPPLSFSFFLSLFIDFFIYFLDDELIK